MSLPCFALLDDNGAAANDAATARSRLYTGYHTTLTCHCPEELGSMLDALQHALQQGWHAVSLMTYELGAALHDVAPRADASNALAEVLLFSTCSYLTATETRDWLATQESQEADISKQIAGIANVRANVDATRFEHDLARIRDYIAAGDTYQVNYTYRLHFDAYGEPIALYNALRARQAVPYGALIQLPDRRCILSFSPELFVQHERGQLRAQPMKGTAAAANDLVEDARRASVLAEDEKNRAENLMIVDLLRNDLGRIAVSGSVQVPHLFSVERFGRVLQMTSTVLAQCRPDASLADIIHALYPCGSITGAPKRRTMEIIRELEDAPRHLYTGAIGWFDPPQAGYSVGDFCLSVPIRTLLLQAPQEGIRRGEMGVGAGIVYDSKASDEFAECRLKANFLTALDRDWHLFETLYATREEGCRHLPLHLQRLRQSAMYFNFDFDDTKIHQALAQVCQDLPAHTAHRLRLELQSDGSVTVRHAVLTPLAESVKVFIATESSHSDDLFLRHKSSVRARYDVAWKYAEARGGFDQLFFNERDELTEGGRSNVFVKLDGRWYTPPLSAGVLPGVMRSVLLNDPVWHASERTITRDELLRAQDIVVCNALRGVLKVKLELD